MALDVVLLVLRHLLHLVYGAFPHQRHLVSKQLDELLLRLRELGPEAMWELSDLLNAIEDRKAVFVDVVDVVADLEHLGGCRRATGGWIALHLEMGGEPKISS